MRARAFTSTRGQGGEGKHEDKKQIVIVQISFRFVQKAL